jgi:hypothetical protein
MPPKKINFYISETAYNKTDKKLNPSYVYPNARQVAEDVIAEWKKPNGHRMVVVKAEMQSGKTSVMRHLCYLLNVKGETTNLEVDEENVHILSSIPDTDLWMQTRERMRGVMKFPEKNVHHSSRPIWKNKDYQLKMMKKRVLILDESHWGSAEGGRISKILKAGHSSYAYNWHEMKDSNTFVVFVHKFNC